MTSRFVRSLASAGAVGLGAGGLLALGGAAAPAIAFTGTCPTTTPAATFVADNVCEVRFTANGSFTPPAGITKLTAVLVAAGGGALRSTDSGYEYAGNGGAVVYVDDVPTTSASAVEVGTGGVGVTDADGAPGDGGDTVVGTAVAAGGQAAFFNLANGCPSPDGTAYVVGDGARGQGDTTTCVGGPGYTLSQLSGRDASLWPAAADPADEFGIGGSAGLTGSLSPSAVPGTGGSVSDSIGVSGSNGLVILRFAPPPPPPAPPKPELAATGVGVSPAVPALAVLSLAGGAVLLGMARRRSRRA